MPPEPLSYLQSIALGFLQGLTEFLPVSSTAHMAIVPQLFGMGDPGATFSAIVQLGPIFAIITYFRHDLVRYVRGMIRNPNPVALFAHPKEGGGDVDARLGWFTILGTLPLLLFGVLLEKRIDRDFRNLYVVAASLILLALVLLWAERTAKQNTSLKEITLKESMTIGFAQVLALIPGTSRSGVTITAGLLQGLDRESAARFSFLLSIPAITAAGLYKLFKVLKTTHLAGETGPYLVGMVVAGLVAYVVIRWFLGYMKEHNTQIFIWYRIALGILVLILLQTRFLHSKTPEADAPAATTARVTRLVPTTVGVTRGHTAAAYPSRRI